MNAPNDTAPSLQALNDKLDRLAALTLIGVKNTLDLEEAALYTGYTKAYLYQLTSKREIPHFKRDRKLYFNKAELDTWLTADRIATRAEIETQATTYVTTHQTR